MYGISVPALAKQRPYIVNKIKGLVSPNFILNGQINSSKYVVVDYHQKIINADEEIVLVKGGGEVAHY